MFHSIKEHFHSTNRFIFGQFYPLFTMPSGCHVDPREKWCQSYPVTTLMLTITMAVRTIGCVDVQRIFQKTKELMSQLFFFSIQPNFIGRLIGNRLTIIQISYDLERPCQKKNTMLLFMDRSTLRCVTGLYTRPIRDC